MAGRHRVREPHWQPFADARYIGRVGALAVALGVGGWVAATPWVASAPAVHFGFVLVIGFCIEFIVGVIETRRIPAHRDRT